MITGKGVYPYSPRGLGSEGTLLNATMAGAILSGSIIAPAAGAGSVQINGLPPPLATEMSS